MLRLQHSFHTSLPGNSRYSIACTGCKAGEDARPVAQLVPERRPEQKAPSGAVLPGQHGRCAVCTGSSVNPHPPVLLMFQQLWCSDRARCRACLYAHMCINTCSIAILINWWLTSLLTPAVCQPSSLQFSVIQFHSTPYSLGCGASCDSSDILA